ncbi:MAG TPA: maleylacetoacetate isomerase [Allosphingosinicella sp.]|nr:maleylacetoacetate isomerase [Allosphingosinicella sp.]
MTRPVLYDYYRSSACYRVRIALNLKGVDYEAVPINLLEGEQKAGYRDLNPQGFVPTLVVGDVRLMQSIAIVAWLEASHPEPRLIPVDLADAAHVRALALVVACDIHPLNNLRVLKRLTALGLDQDARDDWYRHWVAEGFAALEAMAAPRAGRFLFGDSPSLADLCLVPQMFNARRFDVPLDDYPTLVAADSEANRLEPFQAAHPDRAAR